MRIGECVGREEQGTVYSSIVESKKKEKKYRLALTEIDTHSHVYFSSPTNSTTKKEGQVFCHLMLLTYLDRLGSKKVQKWSSWESNPEPSPLSNAQKSSAKKMSYH